jgi:hypothetical protein
MDTRYYSSRQEKQIAKKLGGKVQPNSGAANFVAGDVKLDFMLIDAKTVVTPKKSVTIKEEWFSKIKQEAFAMGKEMSCIAFNFGPDKPNYYAVSENDFKELLNAYKEKYHEC